MKVVESVFQRSLFRRHKHPEVYRPAGKRKWFGARATGGGPTSTATKRPEPRKAHLARSYRVVTLLTIFLCDVAAVVLSLSLVGSRTNALVWSVAVAIAAVAVSEVLGLYQIGCLPVLQRTIAAAAACYMMLLLTVVAVTLCYFGTHLAAAAAKALVCGAALALAGRAAWWLVIRSFPGRFAERSILIGLRPAFEEFGGSGVADVTNVIVLSETDFGHHEAVPSGASRPGVLHLSGRVDRITIIKAGFADWQLRRVLQELDALSSPVTVLADASGGQEARLAPAEAWLVRSAAMRSRTALIKRALDICASLAALVLFFPVLLAVAFAIRIETPGPALFRQLRHGRDGRPFTVLKFRTMRSDVGSVDGSIQAVRGDTRITRVGFFLRKTSIDELPQLFNVLAGSMSLVGPRPHPLALDQRFVHLIERYAARQRVVPGITGWAQVNGFRGETKSVEQMRRRVELDLEYIREHSIAFDLLILFRTASSLLTHRDTAY